MQMRVFVRELWEAASCRMVPRPCASFAARAIRTVAGSAGHRLRFPCAGAVLLLLVGSSVRPLEAAGLKDVLTKDLFGGSFEVGSGLATDITGTKSLGGELFGQFSTLGDSVGNVTAFVPVPSASAGFTYQFDPDLDLFVRSTESLGPIFTERAQTVGKGKFSFSFAYTHAGFSSFDGDNLNGLQRRIGIGTQLQKLKADANLPPGQSTILPGLIDDELVVTFNSLDIGVDEFAFFFTYGITDALDVTFGVPLVNVAMKGAATAQIVDPKNDSGTDGALNQFRFDEQKQASSVVSPDRQSATDSFDDSAFGVGDLLLRAKYRFYETSYVDFAGLALLTIPTGGSDDLRGFEDPTGNLMLIASKPYGFISPHLNAGYAFRSKADVSQALWAAGADLRIFPWLTVIPDFLGFMDTQDRGGSKNNIYQYSFGFKVNPVSQLVLGANFQFPLNSDGLRADVIYTGEIEYTF